MVGLRVLWSRLVAVFRRPRLERELEEELAFHLTMQAEENQRRGMSPADAEAAARRSFGGGQQMQENYRDQRGWWWLETALQDLRYGARVLRRSPGFAAVIVLTLALGAGVNTLIFSIVHRVLLRPLPYPDPNQVVMIWENDRLRGTDRERASYPDFLDIRAEARSFTALAAHQPLDVTLTGTAEPVRLTAHRASAALFDVLRIQPLLGRAFTVEHEKPGQDNVTILGENAWRTFFGGDPAVLGRTILVDGRGFTVIGVAPSLEGITTQEELWVPYSPTPRDKFRGVHNVRLWGRLKPGVDLPAAQAEMDTLMRRLESAYPADNQGRGARVIALHEEVAGSFRPRLRIVQGAALLLLLMACVNVASLLTARAAARQKEIAVRAALGASRSRVARQLLTEAALLAALGGSAGIAVAAAWFDG